MTTGGIGSSEGAVLFLVVIVLLVVRRAFRMLRGTRLRPARLAAYSVLYVALFVLTVATEYSISPWELFVLDGALAVGAAVFATGWVRDHVVLEPRPPDGAWYYRLHPWIPLTYVLLLVARLGISLALLGPTALTLAPIEGPVSPGTVTVLEVVDALLAASTGLLVGRSAGVLVAYRRARARPPTEAPAALRSGL